MSCSYYTFRQGDYYCTKKSDYVNEDVYYKYCRNWDYSDCPVYKGDTSGGCYLTSACMYSKGLPDDCYELETLRNFRDTWLKNSEEGREIIKEYYEVAPKIVSAINETKESKKFMTCCMKRWFNPVLNSLNRKNIKKPCTYIEV